MMERWCLLLCLLLVGVVSGVQITQLPEDEPSSAMMTLGSMDCSGTIRVLPDSILSMATKISLPTRVYNTVLNRIKERIQCKCPSVTDDAFRSRYSIADVIFNFISDKKPFADIPCMDTPGEGFIRDLWKSLRSSTGEVEYELPSTCNWESWKTTGCLLNFQPVPEANMEFQFAAKRCPNSYMPYVSVHCSGSGCNALSPCKVDSDCGDNMVCSTVIGADMEKDMFKGLQDANFYSSTDDVNNPQCPNATPLKLMKNFLSHIKQYFPHEKSDPASLELKVCTPSKMEDIKPSNTEKLFVTKQVRDQSLECQRRTHTTQWYTYESVKKVGNDKWILSHAPGKMPIRTWDGVLPNGRPALADNRVSGNVYGAITSHASYPGETHIAGMNCHGVFTLFGGSFMETVWQMPHLHDGIDAVARILGKVWECRSSDLANFRLNWEAYQPDMWFYGLLTHSRSADLNWGGRTTLATLLFEGSKKTTSQGEGTLARVKHVAGQAWRALGGGHHEAAHQNRQMVAQRAVSKILEPLGKMFAGSAIEKGAAAVTPVLRDMVDWKEMKGLWHSAREHHRHMETMAAAEAVKEGSGTIFGKHRVASVATCNYDVWKDKGTCKAEYAVTPDLALRGRMSRCAAPLTEAPPAGDLYCKGVECGLSRFHCMGGTQCAGSRTCVDLSEKLLEGMYSQDMVAFLLWGGFSDEAVKLADLNGVDGKAWQCMKYLDPKPAEGTTCTSTDRWRADIMHILGSFANDNTLLSHLSENLKVCMPGDQTLDTDKERVRTTDGKDYDVTTVLDLKPLIEDVPPPPPPPPQEVVATYTVTEKPSVAQMAEIRKMFAETAHVPVEQVQVASSDTELKVVVASGDGHAVANSLNQLEVGTPEFSELSKLGVEKPLAITEPPLETSAPLPSTQAASPEEPKGSNAVPIVLVSVAVVFALAAAGLALWVVKLKSAKPTNLEEPLQPV